MATAFGKSIREPVQSKSATTEIERHPLPFQASAKSGRDEIFAALSEGTQIDNARRFQDAQMFGGIVLGEGEPFGKFVDAQVVGDQCLDQALPCTVGKGFKDVGAIGGGHLFISLIPGHSSTKNRAQCTSQIHDQEGR